jgi:hypothetical protein
MQQADQRPDLPIACTLNPAAGSERVREWQSLLTTHRTGRSRGEGYLEVRFRDDEAAARELDRLVDAERDCCSFVAWSVVAHDGELVLTISGEDAALATFAF